MNKPKPYHEISFWLFLGWTIGFFLDPTNMINGGASIFLMMFTVVSYNHSLMKYEFWLLNEKIKELKNEI